MTFTEAQGCVHPSLRAQEGPSGVRWQIACEDCGHEHALSDRAWRRLLAGKASKSLLALAAGPDALWYSLS